MAFAEVKPVGTVLAFGEEVAVIETIKVNISLGSPVSGEIFEVNPDMELAPEAINLDPFGAGWLALVKPIDWSADQARLLDPAARTARTWKPSPAKRSPISA